MSSVSSVTGVSCVSDKFESGWLTVSEFQVFQVFQVFHCFKRARYLPEIARTLRAIIFGDVELILTFVGVAAVVGGHLGS